MEKSMYETPTQEEMNTQEIPVVRNRDHLFKPGQSGNPKGKPKGTKNRMKVLAEGLIGTNASKIVKKVIQMALEGDQACLKMCMDRIIPAQRAIDIEKTESKNQTINITVEAMSDVPKLVMNTIEGEAKEVKNDGS